MESLIQPKQNLRLYGPTSEEGEQLQSGISSNVLIETKQPKEKRIPSVRASQPILEKVKEKGLTFHLKM